MAVSELRLSLVTQPLLMLPGGLWGFWSTVSSLLTWRLTGPDHLKETFGCPSQERPEHGVASLASSKPDPCQQPHCQVHYACGSWHKDELDGDPELHGTEPAAKWW